VTRTSADAAPARRGRRRAVVAAAGVAAVGLALAGCSYLSPAQVVDRYAQADGTWAELRDPGTGATLRLEDMLLVAGEAKGPGVLVGAISSDADQETTVLLALVPPTPTESADSEQAGQPTPIDAVKVPAHGQVTFGPGGKRVDIAAVPVAPGAVVTLTAQVVSGESVQFSAPVVRPQGHFGSITPSAPKSSSATSGATPPVESASPGPQSSPAESPSPSTEATAPTTS
jgi:hypothetical protein